MMFLANRLVLVALLVMGFASISLALEIRLKEKAVVLDRMVTLGDVAELAPADDPRGELAALELFQAPIAGQRVVVRVEQVTRHLEQRAADLGTVRWGGATAVTIVRDGLTIDAEMVDQILNDYLLSQQTRFPRADIRFKSIAKIRPVVVPMGQLSHEVVPSDPQLLRSRRFTIIFRIDGKVVENLAVRAELEAIALVVVAANDLGRGVVLSPQDMNLVEMDLTAVRNPCFDAAEFVGQKLARPLRLGTPIERTMVDFPPLIKRGEMITLRLRQGGLQLTAKGEARQDGRAGDTIRVRNSSSNKDILGRVVEPGLAEVEY